MPQPAVLLSFFSEIEQWISETLGINVVTQNAILKSLIIVFVLWFLRFLLLKVALRKATEIRTLYNWQKTTTYVFSVIGIFLIGRIWFAGLESLATYFGLLSAGIAIALSDVVASLAGWIFLLWRRPFEVGDRITIGEHSGDVIDIRLFQFSLLEIGNWVDADQSTGRVIHIPNGKLFREPQVNYSKGLRYIWDELSVVVTFESDWEKAKKLLLEIVEKNTEHFTDKAKHDILRGSKQFMIHYTTLAPTVYTSVVDIGVNLTLRYLEEPKDRRSRHQVLWEEILRVFAEHEDIDYAYPTQRFYNNALEGKPGAGGPGTVPK